MPSRSVEREARVDGKVLLLVVHEALVQDERVKYAAREAVAILAGDADLLEQTKMRARQSDNGFGGSFARLTLLFVEGLGIPQEEQ